MSMRFQHQSLVAQVAAGLESGLREKEWDARLPGERELCAQYGVSRGTLRTALSLLRNKKLLRVIPRQATLIVPRALGANRALSPVVVGILIRDLPGNLPYPSQNLLYKIEHYLHVAGFELSFSVVKHQNRCRFEKRLEEIVSRRKVASWALCSVTDKTQMWFMRRRIPCLILGSCYPGVRLPALDVDYRAVGRYAAGTFLRLGHRRIALVTTKESRPGDRLGEEGFLDAFVKWTKFNATPRVLYHAGSIKNFQHVLDDVFCENEPPTAFIVVNARYALAMSDYLLQKGIRIPGDVSLICRDNSEFLNWCIPPIAHFVEDVDLFARRSARALIRLAVGARLLACLPPIIPRFVAGGTLAPPS